jgi:flagellar basal-body rod protein FlgC
MRAMEISLTALDVEWRRVELIAMNLANVGSAEPGNAGYVPQKLVSGPRRSFAGYLDTASGKPADVTGTTTDLNRFTGVEIYGVEPASAPQRMVYEPNNPRADEDGFVSHPNVDHAEQMTLLIKSARAYEANVVAMNMARQMYVKALELGRPA